jgi:hypothetical protein
MEHLPLYISIVFILTTFFTVWMLYKATNHSKPVIIIVLLWLMIQSVISLYGFYTVTNVMPPRFALLLLPPVLFIIAMFFTKKGKAAIDSFDAKTLILLHTVRILVELILYALYLYKVVPGIMTFEGRNFDILCGLSAPFVYYFGYLKNVLSKKLILAWNIVCLLLLVNIVITAILSAPFPFQRFAFNQPSVALFYFPFVWLPGCVVPIALLAHLTVIRRLVKQSV